MTLITTNSTLETLTGVVERVTFYNESNGFCVLKVAVTRQPNLLAVTGFTTPVNPGEYINCLGSWVNDRTHGLQFKATQIKISPPTSLAGIERYLGSGLIKGIGPAFAKRLVTSLGKEIFEIIENEPKRLLQVTGIGERRYQQILDSWQEQKAVREIVIFLHQHGVGTSRAVRIYKTYGNNAIELIKQNPYQLAFDIRGIGFQTADALAQKMQIPKDSAYRACAGVQHILKEQASKGHCAIARDKLLDLTTTLLDVSPTIIEAAIIQELTVKHLIATNIAQQEYIFLAIYYYQEQEVGLHIKRIIDYPVKLKFNLESDIFKVQQKNRIKLSIGQVNAIKLALTNKIAIITGGPGVGKTTVINCILQIITEKTNYILLAAPTGRAAKRMTECCKREAKTLHRLLDFDPSSRRFRRTEEFPLIADFVVIDESSMLDLSMMYYLLKAIPNNCSVLFIGDVDQLPSVGPGTVLKDFINSNIIATAHLTEIFRQAATSAIITNAHRINQGYLPDLSKTTSSTLKDWYYVPGNTPDDIKNKLIEIVKIRIPNKFNLNTMRDIQILTPMNRGALGAHSINLVLQQALNPEAKKANSSIQKFGWTFMRGDKVMQIVNNYDKEVFNGDIGYIQDLDLDTGQVLINFEGKTIEYDSNELDEIILAYAATIHKSQGSEFPAVVIPISMHHYTLLERNLLYTAVTRGKKLVVLVGQKQAIAMAVNQANAHKRVTNLQQVLKLC